MALQHDIDIEGGVVIPSAYARLTTIYVERRGGEIIAEVGVNVYRDKATRDVNPEGMVASHLTFQVRGAAVTNALNSPNTIGLLYTWLKTQREFTGATDVLE